MDKKEFKQLLDEYHRSGIVIPYDQAMPLQVPTYQEVTYEVREEGIIKIIGTLDQYRRPLYAQEEMIMPKEVFIKAYNAYIKGDKESYE